MRFKFIFLFIALVVVGYYAKSQPNRVSFRWHSGLNAQTFKDTNISGGKCKLSVAPRFNVGVMIDVPITSKLFVKSGLLFTTKGAKSNDQFIDMGMPIEYNIAYAELPLSFLYKVPLINGNILLGFGTYFSYGIIGNVEYAISTTKMEEKITFTQEYKNLNTIELNNINPFDYGGNLFLGYEFERKISLQFNAQVGMAKVNAENTLYSSKTTFKNRGYGLSIEYKF